MDEEDPNNAEVRGRGRGARPAPGRVVESHLWSFLSFVLLVPVLILCVVIATRTPGGGGNGGGGGTVAEVSAAASPRPDGASSSLYDANSCCSKFEGTDPDSGVITDAWGIRSSAFPSDIGPTGDDELRCITDGLVRPKFYKAELKVRW